MPILHQDPRIEMDRTYTPLEKRRREEMNLRNVSYGNTYIMPRGPREFPRCCKCDRELVTSHVVVNGTHYCNDCRF